MHCCQTYDVSRGVLWKRLKKDQNEIRMNWQARMTGMESLRVLKICLGRWAKLTEEDEVISKYLQWLADEADWDAGIWADWCYSIEQMIKEREEYGGDYHACTSER